MKNNRHRRPSSKPKRQNNNVQGPVIEVSIDRFSHDGRGIGTWQDKTLFVAGALAGETVRAKVVRKQSRFAEAVTADVLVSGEGRVQPNCRHFSLCGGCQLQHMSDAMQIDVKAQSVQDQLRRAASTAPISMAPAIVGLSTGYRTRARLSVWFDKDGTLTLGFRLKNDQKLLKIEQCNVLVPALNQLLAPLQNCLGLHQARAITHIEMIAAGNEQSLVIRHTKPLSAQMLTAFEALMVEYGCHIWLQNSSNQQQLLNVQGYAVTPIMRYDLNAWNVSLGFHPADFTQVNSQMNELMIAQALAWIAPKASEHVVDLFCGIGNFTLPLSRTCSKVTGIEVVDSMVARGQDNADFNGISNATFIAADLSVISAKYLQSLIGDVDALLLDPPRAGAKEVCENITKLSPKRILYVSCNPSTLARDSASLMAAGYKLEKLGILDMFPHTAHVESMALFVL